MYIETISIYMYIDIYMWYHIPCAEMYMYIYIRIRTHTDIQPIPLGVIFSNAVSKAQSSKLEGLFSLKRGKRDFRALSFERFSEKRPSSFELWAFENDTPSGIGCTCISVYVRTRICTWFTHHLCRNVYGVALVSRIDKFIGLFWKRAL